MYKYEIVMVPVDPKNAALAAQSIVEATKKRPHARLAHQTPMNVASDWRDVVHTKSIMLTFETMVED